MRRVVVPGSLKSRLLTHPLEEQAGGDFYHNGGKHFASQNDPEWQTLRNWVNAYRQAHAGEEPPLTISERARLRELEKEVRELKLEREFLGKAAAFVASEYR